MFAYLDDSLLTLYSLVQLSIGQENLNGINRSQAFSPMDENPIPPFIWT